MNGCQPSWIDGATVVAHPTAGTTILRFPDRLAASSAAYMSRLADDPELQNREYFTPSHSLHARSNCRVTSAIVNRGYPRSQEISCSISCWLIVSTAKSNRRLLKVCDFTEQSPNTSA